MDGGSAENAGAIHRPGGSWSCIEAPHIAPLVLLVQSGQRSFAYLAMKWNSWSCHELSGIEFGVEIEERGVR